MSPRRRRWFGTIWICLSVCFLVIFIHQDDTSTSNILHTVKSLPDVRTVNDQSIDRDGHSEEYQLVMVNSGTKSSHNQSRVVHRLVFYNRVPKCGSSAILDIIRQMSHSHNFTFLPSNIYMHFWMDNTQLTNYASDIDLISRPKPLLFERHLHFVNFKRYLTGQPAYINIIRDPIDRLASWYYFRRYQPGHIRQMSLQRRIQSYDECVLSDNPECTAPGGDNPEEGYFKIIPFFCGQKPFCREPIESALLEAIKNVKKYYLVVGTTEKFDEFITLLEHVLPEYFSGASEIHHKTAGIPKKKHSTNYKLPVSDEVKAIMRQKLALEYKFYDFIKRRFRKHMNMFLQQRV